MGEAQPCLVMAILLLTSSVLSLPVQAGLSPFEKALIGRVAASVPGDENHKEGGYYLQGVGSDFTIFKSVSDESQLTPQELEMIRIIAASISGDTNRGGGSGVWNIVKSIELQRSGFGGFNDLEPTQYPIVIEGMGVSQGAGGSIDAPSFDPVPKTCQKGSRLIRGRCRKTFQ